MMNSLITGEPPIDMRLSRRHIPDASPSIIPLAQMSLRVPICLFLVAFHVMSAGWMQAADKTQDVSQPSEQSLYDQLSAGLNGKLYKARPAIEDLMKRKTGLADSENLVFLMRLPCQDKYTDTQDTSLLQHAIE